MKPPYYTIRLLRLRRTKICLGVQQSLSDLVQGSENLRGSILFKICLAPTMCQMSIGVRGTELLQKIAWPQGVCSLVQKKDTYKK